MYYRCELLLNGYSYRITNELKNWDDIEMSFKRADYDGVVRSFSSKFEFCLGAYSLLKSEYRDKYLSATATVVFYKRNNSWLWNEVFRCALDFSTFEDDGNTISINAIDNSLASLIKAKKGTQYEYSVNEIKEEQQLYYDGLMMKENAQWNAIGNTIKDTVETEIDIIASLSARYMPIYVKSSEIPIKKTIEIGETSQKNVSEDGENNYIFKAIKDINCHLVIRMRFDIPISKGLSISLVKVNINAEKTIIHQANITPESSLRYLLFIIDQDIKMVTGDYYYLSYSSIYTFKMKVEFADLSLNWKSRIDPVKLDVVTPTKLLNRLLKSINSGQDGITGEIQSGIDKRLDECVIVPAESIRGLPKAKLYSSYSKFSQWMSSEFGFVPVVGADKIQFVHRDSLFQNKTVKELGDNYNDFQYTVNSSLVYSRVRVGYDKQDYDSVNGRDEFRFTNEYTTGINLTENSIELISPYRADAYGIEFLAQKRGEDTTDSDSDNDVFFVNAKIMGVEYVLVRESNGGPSISGVLSPATMFNAAYSPRFMLGANRLFIGAAINNLTFASSDGNSDVVIDGIKETDGINIASRLFTVGEVTVETGDIVPISDLTGTISLEHHGEIYSGYVKDVSYNYGRGESVKYTLIVKDVSNG